MVKDEELRDKDSCFNRAHGDEMLFVLMARDEAAPAAIRAWIDERVRLGKNTYEDVQIKDAIACIVRMDSERLKGVQRRHICPMCGSDTREMDEI